MNSTDWWAFSLSFYLMLQGANSVSIVGISNVKGTVIIHKTIYKKGV